MSRRPFGVTDEIALHKRVALVERDFPEDVRESIAQLGDLAQTYAASVIDDIRSTYTHYAEELDTIKDALSSIVPLAAQFKATIGAHSENNGSIFDDISERVDEVYAGLAEKLVAAFPPPSHAPGHATRQELFDMILSEAEDAIVSVCVRAGLPEEDARAHLSALRSTLVVIVVTIGDIAEQHPELLPILVVTAITMLIPEEWILDPLIQLFGIGPSGPEKGSIAAWAQRTFFGAEVKAGSWFSLLQSAGMKPGAPATKGVLVNILGAIGALGSTVTGIIDHWKHE
ncbi:hypothetical protein POSPLADRAFT_1055025 [Postia placenta MAD-698-R-SB12]|uniref:Uncharacterized protein n=2 Tax=Postia placenta MAD-698-R-SB12 TaxID=670580 RepID=A0A1X6N712_9APHY|nr:hypothetical protein POSPLADRAFT_1055025 [Postia placenta MAD-698-R-SB12]OSX64407.1 hypothetical protein POSPLADRAFT_1055025 [Postia placenta MAD-698-R-SB12]